MDFINIIVLSVFFCNLAISAYINFNYKKSKSTLYFALFGYTIAAWCFTMFMYRLVPDVKSSVFWCKALYLSASFIPTSFLGFSIAFPTNKVKESNLIPLVAINLVMAILIIFTSSIIETIEIPLEGEKIIKFGSLYYSLYNIYIPLFFGISFIILFSKIRKHQGLIKTQITIILVFTLIASSIGSLSNLILPNYDIFVLNWLGQATTFIWLLGISYAIIRYRLFDARVFVGRITYILIMTLIPFSIFFLVFMLNLELFGNLFKLESLALSFIEGIIFVLIYDALNKYLRVQIKSNIINPHYDPEEVLNKLNSDLSTMLDYNKIINTTLDALSTSIRSNYEGIVIKKNNETKIYSFKKPDPFIQIVDKVFTAWESKKKPKKFIAKEYEIMVETSTKPISDIENEILKSMNEDHFELMLPFSYSDTGTGIIIMGEKGGGSMYTFNELNFINSIGNSLGIALGRALLYEEVEEFNQTLQQKITEATSEMSIKNQQLEESLQKEKDLIDILSHELRTPASIIRNALAMLEMEYRPDKHIEPDKLEKWLDMSLSNIRRLSSIIETMLAATKLDSNRIQVNIGEVDAVALINDSFESLKTKGTAKGLEMNIFLPAEPVKVMGDKNALMQVIDNLIDNAIKYTPSGKVDVSLTTNDMWVKFAVKDSGKGIPPEEIPKLGRKFYRVDNYLSEDAENKNLKILRPDGTGIGLYVVKGLLHNMSGRLEIVSEGRGKGSTFTAFVPLYKGLLTETPKAEAVVKATLQSQTPAVSSSAPAVNAVPVVNSALPDAPASTENPNPEQKSGLYTSI